jgi:hypothetical protein
LLKKGVLQQNKSAGYPDKGSLMQIDDVLQQNNAAELLGGIVLMQSTSMA